MSPNWPSRLTINLTHKILCQKIQAIEIWHYTDVIMSAMASQISSLMIVYSTACSGADQRKHQRPASLAIMVSHNCNVHAVHQIVTDSSEILCTRSLMHISYHAAILSEMPTFLKWTQCDTLYTDSRGLLENIFMTLDFFLNIFQISSLFSNDSHVRRIFQGHHELK